MTIYKSAADEIAEMMADFLEKEAAIPVDWEILRQKITAAKTCQELELLRRYVSRCANPDAEAVFNIKRNSLGCK